MIHTIRKRSKSVKKHFADAPSSQSTALSLSANTDHFTVSRCNFRKKSLYEYLLNTNVTLFFYNPSYFIKDYT